MAQIFDSSTSMVAAEDIEKVASLSRDLSTDNEPDAGTLSYVDDPRNPWNWSIWSRAYHTVIPAYLAILITATTSVTVPATDLIGQEFGMDRMHSILPLTLFTLGIGFGPLLIAPFSEIWGRKWLYVITITLFFGFLGGAAAAPNMETLLACRFLAGILGSPAVAICGGSVADLWQVQKSGSLVSITFILIAFLGPTLGPLIGAHVLYYHDDDWRWTQYIILIIGAPAWLGSLAMKETSQKWITRHDQGLGTRITLSQLATLMARAIIKPTRMLCTEIVVFFLALYSAFAYAMIFSYFSSATYVLRRLYDFNSREASLSFLSIAIGFGLATLMTMAFDITLREGAQKKSKDGLAAPEHRLYSGMVGSVLLPAGLFWNAWPAKDGGNWAILVAAGLPLGLGAMGIFMSIIGYLIDFYGSESSASALAANGILRFTLGAVFPLFTVQMYERLGVHWAGSVFAFLSLPMLPIPWLLFRYGPRLRKKSKFVKT